MTRASRWLRRVEITLWVVGVSLLGVALAASADRWEYQAEQERAFERIAAASQLAPREGESAGTPLPERFGEDPSPSARHEPSLLETIGPPAPAGGDALATEPAAETPEVSAVDDVALDPDLLGRIEIPRLGLKAIVRKGDDESTLRRAVGHIPGTANPGEGGNTALAGHRDTFFRPLRRIEVDDRIRLVVPPHTYEYRVESFRVVAPDELSVLESSGSEELTLLTCYPFRFIGNAPDRFVVKATRVE